MASRPYAAGVLSAMFAGVVRRRRTVLSGAVIVTCAVVALALQVHGGGRAVLTMVFGALVVPSPVLSLVAYFRPRQAAFAVARTPAFRTMPHEGHVFATLTVISLSTEGVLGRLSFNHLPAAGPLAVVLRAQSAALWVLAVVVVALAAMNLALAWRGVGVQLRPDGLVDRTGLGTLVVPWQVLAPGHPLPPLSTATKLALTFAHPQLVRRKGLVFWSSVQAGNVDPAFPAGAIRFYVANPDRRR